MKLKDKINRLKFAKLLMQFGEIKTDKETLIYEGDLVEGCEVFIESESELVPAPNGEYKTEGEVITVETGVIVKIEPFVEDVEEPKEETVEVEMEDEETVEETPDPKVVELEEKIKELEILIAEKDETIAALEEQLKGAEEKLEMSVAKPAHLQIKDIVISNKENKALKYFK